MYSKSKILISEKVFDLVVGQFAPLLFKLIFTLFIDKFPYPVLHPCIVINFVMRNLNL